MMDNIYDLTKRQIAFAHELAKRYDATDETLNDVEYEQIAYAHGAVVDLINLHEMNDDDLLNEMRTTFDATRDDALCGELIDVLRNAR